MRLSATSSRPVEGEANNFFLATCGIGLSAEEGGFQRVLKVNVSGDILQNTFNYATERRYYSFPQLIRRRDNH